MHFSASLFLVLIFTLVAVATPIPISQEIDATIPDNAPGSGFDEDLHRNRYLSYGVISKDYGPCSRRGKGCRKLPKSGYRYHRGCSEVMRCRYEDGEE